MTRIWQKYYWNMTNVWQGYDRIMTGVWQNYDKNMTDLWQEYDKYMRWMRQNYERSMTNIWQEYDLHMKHAYCHADAGPCDSAWCGSCCRHTGMPSCSLGCTQIQAHRATKICCFSNIRSRDGAKSTLWQAHTKYDSVINRPRKLQTKKINDRNMTGIDRSQAMTSI